MPTRRAQIVAAFAALLTTALAGVAHVEEDRDAVTQPTPGGLPWVTVYGGDHQVIHRATGSIRYEMEIRCEGHVATGTSGEIRAAMDTLYAAIVTAVAADDQLGGLAFDCTEETFEPVIEEGADPVGTFTLTYHAQFATSDSDPSVAG